VQLLIDAEYKGTEEYTSGNSIDFGVNHFEKKLTIDVLSFL
jgi:hypothetical protein